MSSIAGIARFATAEDYATAQVAYGVWATMRHLDGARRIPDSNMPSWDRLSREEQRFVWAMYEIREWDALPQGQQDAWALAMKRVRERD